MRLVFADAAEQDLEDIALYIAEDSPIRAVTFTDELQDRSFSLLRAPFKGARRDSLYPGLRVLPTAIITSIIVWRRKW